MGKLFCASTRAALLTICALCVLALAAVFAPSVFMQQQGGPYTLHPSVLPGGGGAGTNGSTRLEGSVGQNTVGVSSGGSFLIHSGFWPGAGGCLSLSRTSQSFAASGGTGTVDVFGLAACAWTATSNDPSFITITSGGSGSGDGTVTYSVAAHSNPAPRSSTMTIAGQTYTVAQGAAFLDVPPSHLFYTEIGKLSARRVTLGCGGGNYCPDAVVTREQMAAFIIRALGEFNPPTPPTQRFQDVPPSNIFYNFIDRMAVLRITQGCSANPPLYCPTQPVTREQMAAFIMRALGEFNPPPPQCQRFADVPPSNIFYAFIDQMFLRGITRGCVAPSPTCPANPMGQYCPTQAVTRGQMAAFLVRAFGL